MKRKLFVALACLCVIALSFSGCGKDTSAKSTSKNDDLAEKMAIVQSTLENYVSGVDYSYDKDDWQIYNNNDGTTSIITKVTTKDNPEKQLVNIIATINGGSYEVHFAEVGGNIYLDDGTIE